MAHNYFPAPSSHQSQQGALPSGSKLAQYLQGTLISNHMTQFDLWHKASFPFRCPQSVYPLPAAGGHRLSSLPNAPQRRRLGCRGRYPLKMLHLMGMVADGVNAFLNGNYNSAGGLCYSNRASSSSAPFHRDDEYDVSMIIALYKGHHLRMDPTPSMSIRGCPLACGRTE